MAHEVVIVGGGLSGLCCALELYRNGVSFLLVEATDRVGGRVKTDQCDGFLLDRGFQVLLTKWRLRDFVLGDVNHPFFRKKNVGKKSLEQSSSATKLG